VRMGLSNETARLTTVVLCVLLMLPVATPAYAVTNAAIRAKQREADAATKKQQDLADELETRGEELALIDERVQKTREDIGSVEAQLQAANQTLSMSEDLLGRRVVSIYRNGAMSPVAVLVGASSFSDFLTRLDLMRRIGSSDAGMVVTVKQAKADVESAQRSLEARQTEELALRAAAVAKQDQVNAALAEQKRYVAGITSDLKTLIEKERKRQEALARKKAAQEAARRALLAKKVVTRTSVGALGSSHAQVINVAEQYLGVPYVWGGTSPSGFDCSGLVQFCYAQIGIALPRTSRAQFGSGSYIPPGRTDLLQPGDLVFFGTNGDPSLIHHVALYRGAGTMIEAPYTGDVVRISSLFARIAQRQDYVGACRP
jgi:peptidoglycan DL-endopeptidase CwlO